MIARIKSFNAQRGFGFIHLESSTQDLFFHISHCDRHYLPMQGDAVCFRIRQGLRGAEACEIMLIEGLEESASN